MTDYDRWHTVCYWVAIVACVISVVAAIYAVVVL